MRHQGGGCLGITHVERAGARHGLGRWVDKKYRASGAQDELVDQPFLARGEARRLGHEQHVEIFRQGLECFRNWFDIKGFVDVAKQRVAAFAAGRGQAGQGGQDTDPGRVRIIQPGHHACQIVFQSHFPFRRKEGHDPLVVYGVASDDTEIERVAAIRVDGRNAGGKRLVFGG